jgi:hypothetical protein
MTRSNIDFLLRRAYEQFTACAAAIALTTVLMVSVNANAANHAAAKATVQILVPTVTIEQLPN